MTSPSPADRIAEEPRDVCRRCQLPEWTHDLWQCVPAHMGTYAEDDDMRREIALRELNQGALAGMPSEVSEHAVDLVLAALNRFDEWTGGRTGKVEQHAVEVAFTSNQLEAANARADELQAQLDALEPVAAPRRRKHRDGFRAHAGLPAFEHYLKQAEAAARAWQREADWLREARDERAAQIEAGVWPPCQGCDEHPVPDGGPSNGS